MKFNFSGMILAAGFGKRMMPLTKDIPKPLIDINGITLLDNSINFLKSLGCNDIIINMHYQYDKIETMIERRKDKKIIKLIYENDILDTGGAVKNAIPNFLYKDILVTNSDIFWINKNVIDVKRLISKYIKNNSPHLLLVEKNKSFGLDKNFGDFILKNNRITRFKKGNSIFYYSGLQILNVDVFENFEDIKFSLNKVWDDLISNKKLFGETMISNCYHVGDAYGLNIVKKLDS
jgi:N-acetyl-alpha-D-muramate 1-phosphate uridylyltransferase